MKICATSLRARIVAAFIVGLFHAQTAAAESLTLMWDLNTEPDVTGYQVHVGQQPGVYTETIDVGNTDRFVYANATTGQQDRFAVTAYAGPLVSPLSTEVCSLNNAPPFLSQPFDQTSSIGQSVLLQLSGGDPANQPVSYSASGLPPGLTLASGNGLISGMPTMAGIFGVSVSISDGSLSVSRTFHWTINAVNVEPVLVNPGPQAAISGQAVSLQLQASDPEGQTLTYTASGLPGGLSVFGSTITGTPTAAGVFTVTATVSDGSLSAAQTFSWTIIASNQAPTLTSPGSQTTNVGQLVALQLQAADADQDNLTFSATGLPDGLQIGLFNGRIAGIPTTTGVFVVEASVSDGELSTSRSFTWTIRTVNVAPLLANPGSQTSPISQSVTLQLQASDANGDAITYTAAGLPPGLTLGSANGRITGAASLAGAFDVAVTVSDGQASTVQVFAWTVTGGSTETGAPSLSNPGTRRNNMGDTVLVQLNANDNENDPITFGAVNLPPGLVIGASSGQITGTPTVAGRYTVTVTASDGTASTTQGFTWIIDAVNVGPTLANPGNQSSVTGEFTGLQLQGSDGNGDTLNYLATGLPPGLAVNSATGAISGTPTAAGTYSVTAVVSDGPLSAQRAFAWTIQVGNFAPALTNPGNRISTAGQPVTLQLQASDANGDALTFSATGLPPGLQIASSTGLITGTGTVVGSFAVAASVSDGAKSSQRIFTWTMQAPNVAPVVTAVANQVSTVGDPITLQVQASDANADVLAFSASGLPPGLQMAPVNGWIIGTVTTAGNFSVTVTVTDGPLSSQRSFAWSVAPRPGAPAPPPTDGSDPTSTVTTRTTSDLRLSSSSVSTGMMAVTRTASASSASISPRSTGAARSRTPPPPASTSTPSTGGRATVRSTATTSTQSEATSTSTATSAIVRQSRTAATTTSMTSSSSGDTTSQALVSDEPSTATTASTATVATTETTEGPTTEAPATSTASAPATQLLPTVAIQTPVDAATFESPGMVHFLGVATDPRGADLTSRIVWTSSLDGALGTGGSVVKALLNGTHTITASVTDSAGRKRTAQVTIVVGR